jgi:hypothetical protein
MGLVLALMVALLLGCAGSDNDGMPPPNMRYLADVLVPVSPKAPSRPASKKWVGRSAFDACGNGWSIALTVTGNKVTGEFWIKGIKYDINGFLDSSGRMDDIPGRKSKFHRNHIGPREMKFSVVFGAGEAKGEHYFSYGRCLTPMRLVPLDRN